MTPITTLLRASVTALLLLAAGTSLADQEDPLVRVQAVFARTVTPGEQADIYRELFSTVFQRVQRSYASEFDMAAMVAAATRAMENVAAGTGAPDVVFKTAVNAALRTLDPHSRYLDAQAHVNERTGASGRYGGLGLQIEPGEGVVRVVSPTPAGPAERAGVKAGDLILKVDAQGLLGLTLGDAVARMRGEPGTPVSLTIRRGGEEMTLSIVRETIRTQALRWAMEGDVLVLRLAAFTSGVATSIEDAVRDASAGATPRAVVLDMRGNPGGLLREAVLVADAFLQAGDIVSLRGRTVASSSNVRRADAAELLPGVPMVVLVDGRSASASELVASALQENGRAIVMGQRSAGKGSVQATYALGEKRGALKLTTNIYHGPSGRTVHKVGVIPDIELVTPASRAASAESTGPRARVEQSRCASQARPSTADAALSCALTYLRADRPDSFLAVFADDAP